MDAGWSQVSFGVHESDKFVEQLAARFDENDGYLDNPVMRTGVQTSRLKVHHSEGAFRQRDWRIVVAAERCFRRPICMLRCALLVQEPLKHVAVPYTFR